MTKKQAFRALCYKFHGTAPGKKKQEKFMKEMLEQSKLHQRAFGDPTKAGMMKALQSKGQSRGQAFVVLNRGGRKT